MTALAAHSDMALAVARDTGWDIDTDAADREWTGIGMGPVGQHRDSEALDRSNFEVVYNDLRERFGADDVDIARFGHWAVGWVDEIIWNAGRSDIAAEVIRWREALADYPVADDMHFSELEWTDNHPSGDPRCYSDDDDCGCGRERA